MELRDDSDPAPVDAPAGPSVDVLRLTIGGEPEHALDAVPEPALTVRTAALRGVGGVASEVLSALSKDGVR